MDHRLILVTSLAFTFGWAESTGQETSPPSPPELTLGQTTFTTYCSSCHGPKGAGLIGPNLTDPEVLHGTSLAEIEQVIAEGVPARSMPPWGAVLDGPTLRATAEFVQSIMDDNLPSGIAYRESTVTPFPFGSPEQPLLLRTFMPTMGVEDDVFAHHGHGMATPKYDPTGGSFDVETMQDPIDGVPGAIAVNFGEVLSYCFDTTECRLLYTWSGGFMDMTNYWGADQGGGRKKFGYVPVLLGDILWRAEGPPEANDPPQFRGYRKVAGVPEFMYTVDGVDYTLRITPGDEPGSASCYYTATRPDGQSKSFTRMLHPQSSEVSP